MFKSITSKFTVVNIIMIAGLVLLAVSVFAWQRMNFNNPQRVFDRMLANSLSSPSSTKIVKQSDDSQKLNQTTVLVTEPEKIVRSVSVLGQTADADTSVTTESIGTPASDFVRYTSIKTSQKNADGNPFDFSSVLGVWGKADQNEADSNGGQLFNQTLLGVVPTGNVRQPFREAILEQIKTDGVYKIDPASVRRQLVDGRPVYSYNVTIIPVAYVTMLKNFALSLGLTQLERVDPAQYKNSSPLKFTFDIDVWSGQLIKTTYADSDRTESYGSYGARVQIEQPASSTTLDELQARLQNIR